MSPELPVAERRYRVVDLLGRGAQGAVYRAELVTGDGFRKAVAIKLLAPRGGAPDEEVLRRFRDEARLLGLVRDRAIVGVDPPTRLDGRWAVVMEFVDGCTLRHLLRTAGAPPPEVALEIVAEVARALDKAWHQPGPDGRPLQLLHRDLKPGNLQITASGEVKVLDFGIARSGTADREARTGTDQLLGTQGYVAPERFVGAEVETTDVFSLGVVLWNLLTARAPPPDAPVSAPDVPADAPLGERAQHLARRMMAADHRSRPTPREVHREAAALARAGAVSLPDWCERHVPPAAQEPPDDLVGHVLTETMAQARTSTGLVAGAVVAGGTGLLLVAAGAAVLLGLALAWVLWPSGPVDLAEAPSSEAAEPPADAPVPPAAAPEPADAVPVDAPAVVDAPLPAAPRPEPAADRSSAPRPAPGPAPDAAPAALPGWRLHTFGSTPRGATVTVDGRALPGVTPLTAPVPLEPGNHTVRMTLGGETLEGGFLVSSLTPTNHFCRFAEDRCQ